LKESGDSCVEFGEVRAIPYFTGEKLITLSGMILKYGVFRSPG
jgi:hypothetical protein